MPLSENLGRFVGALWSPAVRLGATLRHARLLHPEGITFRAELSVLDTHSLLQPLAVQLLGPALVRLSTALWRGRREWPDVLGLAVRLRSQEAITEEPSAGDQDLLFATLRSPWTLGLAPLTTDTHDWLKNDYYAVSPFQVEGLGRVKLRLVSSPDEVPGQNRVERLQAAVQAGQARFTFEARPLRGELAGQWHPLAELRLEEEVTLDPARLRFWPFRTGRGITPVGFIHSLRIPTYRQSQKARAPH
ncbi:hypothetical protein POL68_33400 [Stigmatella sp. ncwal1]|uniref:Uncharacterized protein n=1 Tax=Stigmatella ashevillensis TaxID=2995309 RepID=A0ABT5DIE8_9BACT|nr:hypothetical protein [Stigmatella ashevillena]MDC0713408.1 hypothetical protein [Stigmatella ashevillena]